MKSKDENHTSGLQGGKMKDEVAYYHIAAITTMNFNS